MNCKNCNTELKQGAKYCPNCGTRIPQIRFCPICGTEINDRMVFCPKCGFQIKGEKKNVIADSHSNFSSQTYDEHHIQKLIDDSKMNNSQNSNSKNKAKWIYATIYFILLIFLGNTLDTWGGLLWGIGGAYIYWKMCDWKSWKPYVSLALLYFVLCITLGASGSYKELGQQAILKELKSPSTAEFISYVSPKNANSVYEDYLGYKLKDYQDVAVFEVEAENSFGGRVNNNFYVFYVDKKPICVLEEESALNPNRSYVKSTLDYKGWNK